MRIDSERGAARELTLSAREAGHREAGRIALEGPHSRRRELWLVIRALRDFIAGFRALHFVGPCVTVFGSARCREDDAHARREIWAAVLRPWVYRYDRRRSRSHGGCQSRRARGRWALGWVQHRAAGRAVA